MADNRKERNRPFCWSACADPVAFQQARKKLLRQVLGILR